MPADDSLRERAIEPSAYELWLARVDELAGHLQDLERQDVPVIFGLDHAYLPVEEA